MFKEEELVGSYRTYKKTTKMDCKICEVKDKIIDKIDKLVDKKNKSYEVDSFSKAHERLYCEKCK